MRVASHIALAAAALWLASCSKQTEQQHPGPTGPELPPLRLHPMLDELRTLAKGLDAPNEAKQRELREYGEIALNLVEADPRTASRAERALLEHEAAWFVLEPALAHDEPAVRQRAAWLCGLSQQPVLQLPLLLRLKYELDPQTVIWVADALLKLGNDTGLMWLDAAIDGEATGEQAGTLAINALRDRGVEIPEAPTWDDLHRLLRAGDAAWRQSGTTGLQNTRLPDLTQLEARLARHLQTPEGTQLRPVDDARYVLTRIGQLGVPMLMRTLQAEEHYLRTMPLQVLAVLGPAARASVPAILPLLGDPLTASYAVRALGEIGATDMLPHLRPLLGDRDTELRAAATQALGLLGDVDSKPGLEARLSDAQEVMDVRVGAAFGLLCLGEHQGASAFLDERATRRDYHEPTLTRLRERLAGRKP